MTELIVQPGHWAGVVAGEIEGFLSAVSIIIGLTQKRVDYLKKVHEDIHGPYESDEFYPRSLKNCGTLPPRIVLDMMIMKHCTSDQKKQLKIWYQELLAMEPMDEENPLIKMMLPELSKTINNF